MKKLFGVIGDPIAHSMSPLMHNDLFQLYQLDAHYFPFHVKKEKLAEAINGLKVLGVSGFNVTVPHKVEIMSLLDEIDPLAKAIGAVNTVVNVEGKLIGYNTDGNGYVRALTHYVSDLEDKRVLMIGAGGAARALFFSLAKAGVRRMDLANRTVEKAQALINECPYEIEASALEMNEAELSLEEYDIIIQTTSIGMSPKVNEVPLSPERLKAGAFVSDIIYNPLETRILTEAKQRGAQIQNGLDMFVYQGALAFELWTGIFPNTERMKQIVEMQLGGK
ncbi:shikimate dehydrogenase [Bacillus sp. DNRA2]|uniref:shikimate dehydrogenase n=1 Tax=Bacillus sp. DNRA2 TaxID=2723053 RepID=UPI00145E0963|nr:shikimate dehydrogenase [Bacillus sp. DNRA2]